VKVSIIVATRDRPDDLRRCLASIRALDYADFEVIVADQSKRHTDLSAEQGGPPIIHLRLTTTGKARGLNAAVNLASGSIIALTDDDCEVPRDWLKHGVQALEANANAGIAFGALVAAPHDPATEYVPVFRPKAFRVQKSRFTRAHRLGVGANMFIRRSVFERIGAFDARHGPGGAFRSGDDWEFAYRALTAGFAVIQDPSNAVLHHGIRDYASEAPRRLISSNYNGIGAGYAHHCRSGDLRAGLLLAQEICMVAADIAWNVARWRKPLGFRRLWSLTSGAITGLRSRGPVAAETAPPPIEVAAK
jgi:GT2 family glycosyltransferase